jgi:hypothetical protein
MKDDKKNSLFEEHLRKIKYRVDYKINESPKYRPLVNDGEEYDNLPDSLYATKDGQPVPQTQSFTSEAGDQEDKPKPEGEVPPAPSNDQPISGGAPVPAFDKTGGAPQDPNAQPDPNAPPAPEGGEVPPEPMGGAPMPPAEPVEQVDDIQNDIIKHNIEAMKSIHDQLEELNNTVLGLNSKMDVLNSDVEEVREPTNTEKLMSKKNVSYPYYFNLNDFWNGNWFSEKRNEENEKGIRELPDGSYIADFDDLPQKSKIDVQDSFNEIS